MSSCSCAYCIETICRRSSRLARKPAVNYYEAPIPSEAAIRERDHKRFIAQIARNGRRAQAAAEAAIERDQQRKLRSIERLIAELEQEAEILSTMPLGVNAAQQREPLTTPPRLQRQPAIDATWAPPRGPALSRTEATGCALPPPPPLRRTCQLMSCDEWCTYCRENDRIAAANRDWNPLAEPRPAVVRQLSFIPPPPVGATVVRVPIDLASMSRAALQQIIAAATLALNSSI